MNTSAYPRAGLSPTLFCGCLALTLAACPGTSTQGEDAAGLEADAGLPPSAVDYCEATADMFCAFYLRCGRIAEETPAACRDTFLEVCNEVYEPTYTALEAAGLLHLSAEGIEACASHLSEVPCEHHLLDLDGPCAGVWEGLAGETEACAVGIESMICDQRTTCVLDLSLCGSCELAAATSEVCAGELRCRYPDLCVEEVCVGPALPGESCGDERRCISGASCVQGSCEARSYVAIGELCDASRRCPYRSSCIEGTCRRSALLGEPCGALITCASGYCGAESTCTSRKDPGAPCGAGPECRSGRCVAGVCDELISGCL